MESFVVRMKNTIVGLVLSTFAASALYAGEIRINNNNQQKIWIAVAAWMENVNNYKDVKRIHGGFWELAPGEGRVIFDNSNYFAKLMYMAVAYESNGVTVFQQPTSGGVSSGYFDLAMNNCVYHAPRGRYECKVRPQVVGGIVASPDYMLHFTSDSGVIKHLKNGNTIRFVARVSNAVLPHNIDQ